MILYNKDQVLELATSRFAKLNPKPEQPLCFEGFSGEFDEEYKSTLAYVRSLLRGPLRDKVGSPIFNFMIEEDVGALSTGAKKWVGIIPREMDPVTVQGLAQSAADEMTLHEQERLTLDDGILDQVQTMIRNALIATLHYGLKALPNEEVLNLALQGGENFISYNRLEGKIREICHEDKPISEDQSNMKLVQILKELGAIEEGASPEESAKMLHILKISKAKAWKLYKELGENIEAAQRMANIPGEIAEVDINDEHPSFHFLEHLKAIYGLSKHHGLTPEDRYELQTTANLTWLIARLTTHPVYKTLVNHRDTVEERFLKKGFHTNGLFKKNATKKRFYLDEKWRPTQEGKHTNTWDATVFDSQVEGFDDLDPKRKQLYRGGFRDKEDLSLLVKSIRDRMELGHISDALAGEAMMAGIRERDLDPEKNPGEAERLQAFMEAQARALAVSFGLKEAPKGMAYNKIPKGTFQVVTKLTPDKKSSHSFNFPAVKVYMNVPVDETNPEGESIRMEYRLVCSDTWLRANKQQDSMSYKAMYKMKQKVDMLDIHTARAYNNSIHNVAWKFRSCVAKREVAELDELAALEQAEAA